MSAKSPQSPSRRPVQKPPPKVPVFPPSLVHPDLSGLWSSSHLQDDSLLAWAQGVLVLLCLTSSWTFGTFLPLWVIRTLWRGGSISMSPEVTESTESLNWHLIYGTIAFLCLAYPFVFPVKPWARASRFWLSASYYFEGGCSMNWEKKRNPDDISTPQMHCYHPHGIFTLGLILNSGIRSSAANHSPGTALWNKYVGQCGRVPFIGLAAEQLVQMPIFRHIMVLWTGNIESASKSHMKSIMAREGCFGLCPGGFHELTLFERGVDRIYVKKTGFIYYALKHG